MTSSVLPAGLEKLSPRLPKVDFTTTLDPSTLKDKSVLITGGASGIGLACAEAIASHGAYVTIADLQEEAGEGIAKDLSSKGFKVQFVKCDVTAYDSQVSAFKSAITFGGDRLDILVPCAGIIAQKNLVDMAAKTVPSLDSPPPEPGYSGAEVNLRGVYYSCYLALHYFRLPPPSDVAPFKKAIVLIASVAGFLGYPFSTTYSISKFGVRGILYGIRERALENQVRVNLVAPWYIKTTMTETGGDPKLEAHLAMFGFAPMENVVDAVLRFSADETVAGRSAVILPEGNFDVGDDIWDGYGGVAMQGHMGTRLKSVMVSLAVMQKQKEQQATQ